MKKIPFLILILFCLQNCNVQSKYSKDDALTQSFQCLEIKQELGVTSNLRNPYLMKLGEILKNDTIPDKSLTDAITTLSIDISNTITRGKDLIENSKPKHKDSRFFDATLEYLELNEKLEAKNKLLLNSLINPDSDKDKEMLLGQEVGTLTQRVLNEQTEYKKKETEFYSDNEIIQREVDSIVSIIKNK